MATITGDLDVPIVHGRWHPLQPAFGLSGGSSTSHFGHYSRGAAWDSMVDMGLECLIVTSDSVLLGHLRATLAERALLHLRQDSESAIEFVSRRHFDGLVIDCDDVREGAKSIAQLRNTRSNKRTTILAVLNGFTKPDEVVDQGADFVVSKPIQKDRLQAVLDIAVPRMEREHRRYFRHEVDLPVTVQNAPGEDFPARMKNVSEGGLALKMSDPLKLTGVVTIEFDIPSVEPQPFRAKAEVVWSDSFVTGVRFLYMDRQSTLALQQWLNALEAQLHFRESARPQC